MGPSAEPFNETGIARCRVILSVVAMFAVLLDPTEPVMVNWLGPVGTVYGVDPRTLGVLGTHLIYSLTVCSLLRYRPNRCGRITLISSILDVLFGGAIVFCTEGTNSPFYAFFTFGIVAVGFRAGFRWTIVTATASVGLYLGVMLVSAGGDENFYVMRSVYLGVAGYLIGYLGQRRLDLEMQIRALLAREQRTRFARELHDGCLQTVAGINFQLGACRELLGNGRISDAVSQLAGLQAGVRGEYDKLRAYTRTLAGNPESEPSLEEDRNTQFCIRADFSGSGALVDQVLQIVREGITNVRRHAHARSATVNIRSAGSQLFIEVHDDGVGPSSRTDKPWSISSRVAELGGCMQFERGTPGTHLTINVAAA
jgi:hypothetical protein